MAATKAPKPRVARRHLPPAEKRRIVELTLQSGASLVAIARDHGVHPNSVGQWKALYRAGKLDAPAAERASRMVDRFGSPTFVPVSVLPDARPPALAACTDTFAGRSGGSGILQLVFSSGATLRIETGAVDAALVCALVAELRK
jgi:transposase-like protein